MMHFPIKDKPKFDFTDIPVVFEYENVISKTMAQSLIDEATSHSGWHRRGSKTSYTSASFTTTLLSDTTHPIYKLLDDLWKQFTDEHKFNIDFIEPYEIKEYRAGDKFDNHYDWHGRIHEPLDRKMNLTLQLSDSNDYEGGDLVVINKQTIKNLGSAIFFPAHYMHRVTEITQGTRYCLIGHAWGNVDKG
jgi:predicted 2-oxoglutarate/Fe(II)-dependent dioxygenase YbiX